MEITSDKTILRPSYLHNAIAYTGNMGKTASLYWIRVQACIHKAVRCLTFRPLEISKLQDISLELSDHFISSAAEAPVKFQSDGINTQGHSFETLQDLVESRLWIEALVVLYISIDPKLWCH